MITKHWRQAIGRVLLNEPWTPIILWDLNTMTASHRLGGHTQNVMSVAFSPVENILVSGSEDSTVRLWNPVSGNQQAVCEIPMVWAVKFPPKGNIVAAGLTDIYVYLIDAKKRTVVATLPYQLDSVKSLAYSPNGKWLAVSGSNNGVVRVWNNETGTFKDLNIHDSTVESVAFSPDSTILATASLDKLVKLIDIESGQIIKILAGHEEFVNSVAFSPNGKILASASDDGTVRLWYIETGRQIKQLGNSIKTVPPRRVTLVVSCQMCGLFT